MKLRLKSRSAVPYGGNWRTRDRLTGFKVEAYQVDLVVERLKEHRKANGIPIGLDFEAEIEQWLCEDHPEECEWFDPLIPGRPRELSLGTVISGTRVMMAFYASGKPLVPRAEAERRASICQSCQYNQPFSMPCSGLCGALLSVVNVITDHQGTSYDKDLKACFLCGCFNRAQIWLPYEVLDKGLNEEMRQQFLAVPWCWKKPDASTPPA